MGADEGETPKTTQNSISKDQFLAWKRQKDAELLAKQAEAARKREEDIASGRVLMNGRELFLHEPWVFDDTHSPPLTLTSSQVIQTLPKTFPR